MGSKKRLIEEIWSKEKYYIGARHSGLRDFSQDKFFLVLKRYVQNAKRILECGCGSASILEKVWHEKGNFYGVDISKTGIKLAKKRLQNKKNVRLFVGDLEKLELKNDFFDLVYSAYVLEHLVNPERAIEEMIRVTGRLGYLIFISPNYGSPLSFSSSLATQGSLLKQAARKLIKSHLYIIKKPNSLDWLEVEPKCLKEGRWESDWDTVVEPYLQTLIYFLRERGMEIVEWNSGIGEIRGIGGKEEIGLRLKVLKAAKSFVQLLGQKKISPYFYYGEKLFVVGRKNETKT